MKKTGLNGYLYEINVGYNYFDIADPVKAIPFVHNYLMAKYSIK